MPQEPDSVIDYGRTESEAINASGNTAIDGVLGAGRWVNPELAYSFTDSSDDYARVDVEYPDQWDPAYDGWSEMTAANADNMRAALEEFANVSGLTFTEIDGAEGALDEDQEATIRFAQTDAADVTSLGGAPVWSADNSGEVWLSSGITDTTLGSEGRAAALDAIGAAVGLADADASAGALPAEYNTIEYTAMNMGATTSGDVDFAQSLMTVDIAAVQYMYGANYDFNADDTEYTFDTVTGEMSINGEGQGASGNNVILRTIWDGGGTDHYNFANYTTNMQIDLKAAGTIDVDVDGAFQEAQHSSLEAGTAQIHNAWMFEGNTASLIENATGGSGNDNIEGNELGNVLAGSDGDDTLSGLEGDDTLIGGAGDDTLMGGTGQDTAFFTFGIENYEVTVIAGTLQIYGEGVDTVTSDVEFLSFDGALRSFDNILASGELGDGALLLGTAGDDELDGGDGNDTIDGGAGNDSLQGEAGDDLITGGIGDDTLRGGYGDDTLLGGDGNDRLEGLYGQDYIDAGAGDDHVFGRDGDDVVYGREGNDTLIGSMGTDTVYGGAGNDILAGSQGNDEIHGGDGNDLAFIGVYEDSDSIYMEAGNDFVDGASAGSSFFADGGTGNDTLNSGVGDDTLQGGAGNDQLNGGSGDDTLSGGGDSDTLTGGDGDDVFIVQPLSGTVFINDFGANGAQDRIDLSEFGTYDTASALSDVFTIENGISVIKLDIPGEDPLELRIQSETPLEAADFYLTGDLEPNGDEGDDTVTPVDPTGFELTGAAGSFDLDGTPVTYTATATDGTLDTTPDGFGEIDESNYALGNDGDDGESYAFAFSETISGLQINVNAQNTAEAIDFTINGVDVDLNAMIADGDVTVLATGNGAVNADGDLQGDDTNVDAGLVTTLLFNTPIDTIALAHSGAQGGATLEVIVPDDAEVVADDDTTDEGNGQVVYTLTGVDAGLFEVDADTGDVAPYSWYSPNVNEVWDADRNNIYDVTVVGSDEASGAELSRTDLQLVVTQDGYTWRDAVEDEDTGGGGTDDTEAGDLFVAGDNADGVTYALSGSDAGLFELDAETGDVGPYSWYTPDASQVWDGDRNNIYEITVTGTDDATGAEASRSDLQLVVTADGATWRDAIDTDDGTDDGGTDDGGNGADDLTILGENADGVSYEMAGVDSGLFEVDPETGDVSPYSWYTPDVNQVWDADRDNIYEMTVVGTDDTTGEETSRTEIELVVTADGATWREAVEGDDTDDGSGTDDGTNTDDGDDADALTVAGENADGVSYAISGVDSGLFEVDPDTGDVGPYSWYTPNVDQVWDMDRDNVYEVTVIGTDDATGVEASRTELELVVTAEGAVWENVTEVPEEDDTAEQTPEDLMAALSTGDVDEADAVVVEEEAEEDFFADV